MTTKKYIKKVIITGDEASADARGERLRKIRNLANLSRIQLCDTSELNLNTYKGWELARFGGLPVDGAERVIKRVVKEGVICSVEWLLYGKGLEPYIIPKKMDATGQPISPPVFKEIMYFQNLYPNSVYAKVIDDALSPSYEPGDYVAGIRKYGEDINVLLNQICIVQLTNGETMLRYLREGNHKNHFQLLATNINSKFIKTIEAELNFAAVIIRHYKPVDGEI